MNKKNRLGLRTWIEIDKKAIKHNYEIFRSLISQQTKLMGVVKSNAYGHNLTEFAQELEELGVDYLAVDSVVEGITLRKEGIKIPILILGYTLPEMIEKAAANNLEITVSSFDYFTQIKKLDLKKPVRVQVKVDTGMHRHGFQESDIKKVLGEINPKTNRNLFGQVKIVGLYTHFASAKDPKERKETEKQIKIFNKWKVAFKKVGIKVICHACATAGTILFPEAHFDMIRVGIGLYGIWPSAETQKFAQNKFNLKPVLSWKTIIGEINNPPTGGRKGERIGYDLTEKLKKNSRVAVLPIGYWHGFPRAFSSIGQVLVDGKKCKVLGRVCMDIIMVDITKIKSAQVGDEVVIIGRQKKSKISVDDMANLLKASSYELITRINPLIKRIYI